MGLFSRHDENQLLRDLQMDDASAFEVIYHRYWDRLFVVAMHRLHHAEEAREIVQDVFFNLWKRRHTLQLRHSLHTYLATAVKYELLNRLASKARQRRYMDHASETWTEGVKDTEEQLRFSELQEELAGLVRALPEKCRIVFQLSREKGFSQKMIAAELGIAEKTVEAHLANAIRKLKAGLGYFLIFVPTAIGVFLYWCSKR
jgi:RNA polymerase sigma-70 factor (ECF subfamily)